MGLNFKFTPESPQICLQPKYLLKIVFLHSDLEEKEEEMKLTQRLNQPITPSRFLQLLPPAPQRRADKV